MCDRILGDRIGTVHRSPRSGDWGCARNLPRIRRARFGRIHVGACVMQWAGVLNFRAALLASALYGGVLAAAPVAAGQQDFTLYNETGVDIYQLYVSPASTDQWEEDVLGVDVLEDGDAVDISFDRDEDADLRAGPRERTAEQKASRRSARSCRRPRRCRPRPSRRAPRSPPRSPADVAIEAPRGRARPRARRAQVARAAEPPSRSQRTDPTAPRALLSAAFSLPDPSPLRARAARPRPPTSKPARRSPPPTACSAPGP